MDAPDPYDTIPSLSVPTSELAAYRSAGSILHLAHARALDEARAELEGLLARASPPAAPARALPHECQQRKKRFRLDGDERRR